MFVVFDVEIRSSQSLHLASLLPSELNLSVKSKYCQTLLRFLQCLTRLPKASEGPSAKISTSSDSPLAAPLAAAPAPALPLALAPVPEAVAPSLRLLRFCKGKRGMTSVKRSKRQILLGDRGRAVYGKFRGASQSNTTTNYGNPKARGRAGGNKIKERSGNFTRPAGEL